MIEQIVGLAVLFFVLAVAAVFWVRGLRKQETAQPAEAGGTVRIYGSIRVELENPDTGESYYTNFPVQGEGGGTYEATVDALQWLLDRIELDLTAPTDIPLALMRNGLMMAGDTLTHPVGVWSGEAVVTASVGDGETYWFATDRIES